MFFKQEDLAIKGEYFFKGPPARFNKLPAVKIAYLTNRFSPRILFQN